MKREKQADLARQERSCAGDPRDQSVCGSGPGRGQACDSGGVRKREWQAAEECTACSRGKFSGRLRAGEAVAEVMRMRETFKMTTKANDSLVVLTGNDQHGPLVELTTQEWDFFQMTPREARRLGNALLKAAESAKAKAQTRARREGRKR